MQSQLNLFLLLLWLTLATHLREAWTFGVQRPRRASFSSYCTSKPFRLYKACRACACRPGDTSLQGSLISIMFPGLFRILTKGLLVRQANVCTAVLIVARIPTVPQQNQSTHLKGWKRCRRLVVIPWTEVPHCDSTTQHYLFFVAEETFVFNTAGLPVSLESICCPSSHVL